MSKIFISIKAVIDIKAIQAIIGFEIICDKGAVINLAGKEALIYFDICCVYGMEDIF